jgi:hypothetical protein
LTNKQTIARTTSVLYYAAAATTALAGILHLVLAPNILEFNLNTGIFFIIAGIVQLLWVVPMLRKWGGPWYFAGIGGTIILIVLFAITRMPANPIIGRAGPIMPMALVIEVMQLAFIGLGIAVIIYESKVKKEELSGKTASRRV